MTEHWSQGDEGKHFWMQMGRLGLTKQEVHRAMGVASAKQFAYPVDVAFAYIDAYLRGRQTTHHVAPEAPAQLSIKFFQGELDFLGTFRYDSRAECIASIPGLADALLKVGAEPTGLPKEFLPETPEVVYKPSVSGGPPEHPQQDAITPQAAPVMCIKHNAPMALKSGKFGLFYSHPDPSGALDAQGRPLLCKGAKLCTIHGVDMKLRRDKDTGEVWYSHQLSDESWCYGSSDQAATQQGPPPEEDEIPF